MSYDNGKPKEIDGPWEMSSNKQIKIENDNIIENLKEEEYAIKIYSNIADENPNIFSRLPKNESIGTINSYRCKVSLQDEQQKEFDTLMDILPPEQIKIEYDDLNKEKHAIKINLSNDDEKMMYNILPSECIKITNSYKHNICIRNEKRKEFAAEEVFATEQIKTEYEEIVENLKEERHAFKINLNTGDDEITNFLPRSPGIASIETTNPYKLINSDLQSVQKSATMENSIESFGFKCDKKIYREILGPREKVFVYLKRETPHQSDEDKRFHNCKFCPYKVKWKYQLRPHMLTHMSADEVQMYECYVCAFQTKHRKSLVWHLQGHKAPDKNKMHRCNYCSYQGKTGKLLKQHLKIHKNLEDGVWHKCEKCPYQTRNSSHLKRHLSAMHKEKLSTNSCKKQIFVQCEKCNFQCVSKMLLKKHFEYVHRNPKEI